MYNPVAHMLNRSLLALFVASFLLVGCDSDSNGGNGATDSRTIDGQVTDDAGFASKFADIEGATVTAFEVTAQGTLNPAEGQATTNASGQYTLETEANSELMVVAATKGSEFSGRTLAQAQSSAEATVSAMTINNETTAESNVYVVARQQQNGGSSSGSITAADVAFYVDSDLTAEIESGAVTESEVANSIRASLNAEARSYSDGGASDDEISDYRQRRSNAFLTLQSELVASTSANSEAAAIVNLQNAMIDASAEADIDAGAAARARQASAAAFMALSDDLSANARLMMRKKVELLAAASTSNALFVEFESNSELEAGADNIASAGTSLRLAIMNASSESDIDTAWDNFQGTVNTELSAALSIDTALRTVIDAALVPFKTAYQASLSSANSAEDVVEARATFTTNVESSVETILDSMANADAGARIWALATIR